MAGEKCYIFHLVSLSRLMWLNISYVRKSKLRTQYSTTLRRSQQLYHIAEESATLPHCGVVSNYITLRASQQIYYKPISRTFFFDFFLRDFILINNEYYNLQPSIMRSRLSEGRRALYKCSSNQPKQNVQS